jgi:uncharacterized protein (TIGR03067 family)
MWRVLALLLAVGFVVAAEPEKKDAKKDDDKKSADTLEGTWTSTSITDRGKQVRPVAGYETVLVLKKDGSYAEMIRSQTVEEGTYKTDAAKSPKEIETEATKGPDKGKKRLGIYEQNGDTLKITFAVAGEKDRPTKFEGDKYQAMVLTRKKK